MIEAITVWLLPVILEKVLDVDEEEDIKIEPPAWFPSIPVAAAAACCLFSLLAGIICWKTNNYLEKAVSKHPNYHDDALVFIYAGPYCFGLVISIILAVIFFFVTIIGCASTVATAPNIIRCRDACSP